MIIENKSLLLPKIGLLEWHHLGDYEHAEITIQHLKNLKIKELRTGISWADYYCEEGKKWFDWLIPKLAQEVQILPCFLYTPPSLGIHPKTSSPPRNPKLFADFLDIFVGRYDKYLEWIELWNEPNNRSEYDYTLDYHWNTFCEMIGGAAYWMKHLKKKTVLGGMSPIDPNWLDLMFTRGVMNYIDAIGIHAFPFVFESMWNGWKEKVDLVNEIIQKNKGTQEIWITEAGFSTWQHDEKKQLHEFIEASEAPISRLYWYGLKDLDPKFPTVDGFHQDEREYYFGMVDKDHKPKLLYRMIEQYGVNNIKEVRWLTQPFRTSAHTEKKFLITGGAGFIGTNLAKNLLADGHPVMILDNLTRPGVENNLKWLVSQFPRNLDIEIADIRNEFALNQAVHSAHTVFHFAAQVAVTTSCQWPLEDFDINAKGTLNLLEAIRQCDQPPCLIFTSTNKVYGSLEDLEVEIRDKRYELSEKDHLWEFGISETRPIDFHSPYGCSKGTADHYILDYARIFNLKAVVFRMSCIYGPHQLGTEDQGWVAHFLIQALQNKPLTIFGDGLQVRDVLFVEDLIHAFKLANKNIAILSGQAFNIGGGSQNTISLIEFIDLIESRYQKKLQLCFESQRPGDQKYYVSDTRKFQKLTGWKPQIGFHEGIDRLFQWLKTPYHSELSYHKDELNFPLETAEENRPWPRLFL